MMPASDRLAEAIAHMRILSPRVPVVHNVHAATERDPEEIRRLLVKQIYSPVQWTACVQAIIQAGARHIIECGPGKVLSGLCRRIDKSLMCYALEEPEGLRAAAAAIEASEGGRHE
jgi:[acyl-carrier-protein] S-malonyltransferase